ncbi:hypothetical protein [Mariniflexile sp. AS56]|uniref:hypothetical protein n=1 Tax=Mariniflexile sp. AS56 TaxID=3063957 RepID=UPI0026E97F46|nr:hypothetical protein [Mariniflexile sp. AS56]MDO7172432.1 hypothetical protein [Mariniflexile sp. AS56]
MKRIVLTVIVGLLISLSAMAQSKSEKNAEKKAQKAVEKVQTAIELTEEEKAKYFELQKTQFLNRAELPKGLKESDPDTFKEKTRENRKQFEKNLLETFGDKRGKAILNATKKKKKK